MPKFTIILLMFLTTIAFGDSLKLNENKKFYDVLPSSEIYIDKKRDVTINDVLSKKINDLDESRQRIMQVYHPINIPPLT